MIDLMTPIKCSIGSINLPNGDTHARPSMFVSIRTEGGTSGLSGLVPSVLPSRRRQDGGCPYGRDGTRALAGKTGMMPSSRK